MLVKMRVVYAILVRYTLLEYVGANSIFISLQFANAPN